MMIKTESYKIFSEIYCRLIQLQWSYILAMDVGVYRVKLKHLPYGSLERYDHLISDRPEQLDEKVETIIHEIGGG